MRHKFAIALGALLLAICTVPALAQYKTRDGMMDQFNADLAYNSTGLITDADVRGAFIALSSSTYNIISDTVDLTSASGLANLPAGGTKSANYTLTDSDAAGIIKMSSASAIGLVIPSGLTAGRVFAAYDDGADAGIPFLSAGAGLTLSGAGVSAGTVDFKSSGTVFIRIISASAAHAWGDLQP